VREFPGLVSFVSENASESFAIGPHFRFEECMSRIQNPITLCKYGSSLLGCVGKAAAVGGLAMLLIVNRPEHQYMHEGIDYWKVMACISCVITIGILWELIRLSARVKDLALTDDLTRIPNRRAFFEYLTREKNRDRRYRLELTVAYVDLDKFKALNDRLGHTIGDRVLVRVANILRDHLRATDFVARIGGDEFVIVLPQTGKDAGGVVLTKLQRVLDAAMQEYGWDISFSIGAVTFHPPPDSVHEIVSKADEAMYAVKRNGKNGLRQQELVG